MRPRLLWPAQFRIDAAELRGNAHVIGLQSILEVQKSCKCRYDRAVAQRRAA